MTDYLRTTRECPFEDVRPELRDAIAAHVGAEAASSFRGVTAWETTSKKTNEGVVDWIFTRMAGGDRDPVHWSCSMLVPSRFIFAIHGEKRGTQVFSAMLVDLQVTSPTFTVATEHGVDVIGLVPVFGHPGPTSYYLGFEKSPIGERCTAALREAITRAKTR